MNPPKTSWHHLSPKALQTRLHVAIHQGLNEAEAQQRLEQYGSNRLTPRRGKSPLRLLLEQFHQPLVYILIAAATVTTFLQEWVDSSVIFGVVLINAIIGFIQEANALKATYCCGLSSVWLQSLLRWGLATVIPCWKCSWLRSHWRSEQFPKAYLRQ